MLSCLKPIRRAQLVTWYKPQPTLVQFANQMQDRIRQDVSYAMTRRFRTAFIFGWVDASIAEMHKPPRRKP